MEKYRKESIEYRRKVKQLSNKRQELLDQVAEYDKQIEEVFQKEDILRKEIIDYERECMSIDTQNEDEEGWEELRKKARMVKAEKNQMIKERKIVTRGVAGFLRKKWNEREDYINKLIDDLQDREDYLYDKLNRVSRELSIQKNDIKYISGYMEALASKDE